MLDLSYLNLDESLKLMKNCADAAQKGWYVNWYTPVHYAKDSYIQNLDELMIEHISRDFENLKKSISSVCPERMHILNIAFELHKNTTYVASIPLFLTQTEGIFQDGIGAGIFSNQKKKLKSVLSENLGNIFNAAFFSATQDTQFRAQTSSIIESHYILAPNRHGILHGNKKYLNYGTHLNSCKSISLLAYAAFMTESYKDLKEV